MTGDEWYEVPRREPTCINCGVPMRLHPPGIPETDGTVRMTCEPNPEYQAQWDRELQEARERTV